MIESSTEYVSYIKDGRKLIQIGNGTSKKAINKTVTDYISEYECDEGDKFIIIYYDFSYKVNGVYGPMFMACEIRTVNDKGKISVKDIRTNAIHYTVNELKNRGFMRGDYKRLFNKLNTGTIESGLKKVYTAKHLD